MRFGGEEGNSVATVCKSHAIFSLETSCFKPCGLMAHQLQLIRSSIRTLEEGLKDPLNCLTDLPTPFNTALKLGRETKLAPSGSGST